jgi:hypothetical protein
MSKSLLRTEAEAQGISLDEAKAEKLKKLASLIRERHVNMKLEAIEIGQYLLAAKKLQPRGDFLEWLKREFAWSIRTAENLMGVAKKFGDQIATVANLPIAVTAMYELPRGEAVNEAIELAKAGVKVDRKQAKAIKSKSGGTRRTKKSSTSSTSSTSASTASTSASTSASPAVASIDVETFRKDALKAATHLVACLKQNSAHELLSHVKNSLSELQDLVSRCEARVLQ